MDEYNKKHITTENENALLTVLKTQERMLSEILDIHKKNKVKHRKDAYIISSLTFLLVVACFVAAFYWNQRNSDRVSRMAKAESLQQKIDQKIQVKNELMQAMTNFRGVRDQGIQYCQNGKYTGPDKAVYSSQLFAANYAIIGATYKSMGAFSESIVHQSQAFLEDNIDVDHFNLCSKNAISNHKLRILQNAINANMLNSIQQLQNEKEMLFNK